MPVGGTQRMIGVLAEQDGIKLSGQSVRWINRRGHLGLPDDVSVRSAVAALERIYLELGGDLAVLATATLTPLTGDFVHEPSGTLIEVDESQHFTSFRLRTLELYPPDTQVGFDIEEYKELCRERHVKADKYRRTNAARGFGAGGRQRQRAYNDALRDLATAALGHPPLIRIDAADGDPVEAYRRCRTSLRSALGVDS